ncbi:hypothetical protein Ndes2526B_g00160 [Nannochloris sp. 'desiccata']
MLAVKRLQQIGAQLRLLSKTKSTPGGANTFQTTPDMAHLTTTSNAGNKYTTPSSCSHIFTKHLPEGMDPRQVVNDFMATVNMQPREIEEFLATEDSRKAVDSTENEEEHQGRHLARRVCELLEKVGEKKNDFHAYELSLLYEGDLQQMFQVTEYVSCHLEEQKKKEQQGEGKDMDPLWRFRLMNCGYDPLKEE